MSENPTGPGKEPSKSPPTIKRPQAGGNGEPKKPAQNGVGPPSNGWDMLRDPKLDEKEDVGVSKSKN